MTCWVYQGSSSESVKACDSGRLHLGVLLQQYWAKEAGPYTFIPAAEMAQAFQNSKEGRAAAEELVQPPERTKQGGQYLPDQEEGWLDHF